MSSTRKGGESYTFDAFGNHIAMNGLLRTTDSATNRLTEAAYDRRGNLLAWGGQSFTWDTMERMTSMQGPGINRSMFYDANGERIVVRGGSSYTFTLRDLGQEVLREVSSSSATGWQWGKDYIYRDGVLLASQSTSAGEGLRYHFPDHLTSPRLLTNRCGERGVEHRLSSFGVDVLSGSSQSADRMRFTMHERDLGQLSTTLDDLDSMHARYYNPNIARFLSVDPGRAVDTKIPQSWNMYAYVRNNPVNKTDPDGKKDRRTPLEKTVLEDPDVLQGMGQVIEKTHYEKPLKDRNEAGAVIVETATNDYGTTPVKTGGLTSVSTEAVVDGRVVSTGQVAVGAVHSHPGSGPVKLDGKNVWLEAGKSSAGDGRNAAARGVPSYIVDSNRALIRYDPKTGKDVRILTGKDYRAYRDRAIEALKPQPDDE